MKLTLASGNALVTVSSDGIHYIPAAHYLLVIYYEYYISEIYNICCFFY